MKPQSVPSPPLVFWLGLVAALFLFVMGLIAIADFRSMVVLSNDWMAKNNYTKYECASCLKDGYAAATTFFLLGAGVLLLIMLLPRLQSFKFSGSGIELALQDLKEDVNSLKSVSNQLQEQSVGTNAAAEPKREASGGPAKESTNQALTADADDPQKGKWGGQAARNGRRLSATVRPMNKTELYQVTLLVEGTATHPLRQAVTFHLHPTFANPDPVIAPVDNVATLHLSHVYGAFTVGVETDNGQTKLELDLAELAGVPEEFKDE